MKKPAVSVLARLPLMHHEDLLPNPSLKDTRQEPVSTNNLGLLVRFTQQQSAAQATTALGQIQATYADAIEFQTGGTSAQMRGLLMVFCTFLIAIILLMIYFLTSTSSTHSLADFFNFWNLTTWLLFLPCIFFGWPATMIFFNAELYSPSDQPILFDRKHRTVSVISFGEDKPDNFPVQGSAWRKIWWWLCNADWFIRFKRPAQLAQSAVIMNWDCMQAEHQATLTSTGATVLREHQLIFKVYQKPLNIDPHSPLVAEFPVVGAYLLNEMLVPMVYEHIRRFMEEGGPALAPGDTLADTWRPASLWQSIGAVGPVGPRFGLWWKKTPKTTVFLVLISLVMWPFFLAWGICNWLSHKTMISVNWPDEVLQQIGLVRQGHTTGADSE